MKRLALAPLVCALLVLAGCSSGSGTAAKPPRPAGGTSAGPVTGGPVTEGPATGSPSASATSEPQALRWTPCGPQFGCSTLRVPLDEARPTTGSVDLALTRLPARTTGTRIGSLLVNPGGPGVSAVEYLQAAYANIPEPVRDRFDLVAFDPRGVGRSAPVRCETTAQLDAYFHLDPSPDDAASRAAYQSANRTFAQSCAQRSGRLLPYVSTDAAARDLDRVRAALGDARLTYLGYSYGTAIGASYLEQFPTHVRAMVLDGALDPTLTWDQLLAGQSRGFDVALQAFFDDCQRTRCAFRKAVKGPLPAAYDALEARVGSKALPAKGGRTLGPGEFSYGVGEALYSKELWPTLGGALAAAEHGRGEALLVLSDAYLERTGKGYSNLVEANYAVTCIDRPWPRTVEPYQALARQVGQSYPRFGPSIALSGLPCASWPAAPVSKPHAVRAAAAPTVVVVGTTRDPATPYVWAQGLARQLAHAVLLTHEGDGHTVYGADAPACIARPVNAYLLTAKAPAATTC